MHYTTLKDAAICTALAALTGWWQPRDASQAIMCYIFIFVLLVVAFEVARDWELRNKKAPGAGKQSGTKENHSSSL